VEHAYKPDFVRRSRPRRDRHSSGPPVARTARCYLPASSADRIDAGLLGIAARRDCPFHPRAETGARAPAHGTGLVSVAL